MPKRIRKDVKHITMQHKMPVQTHYLVNMIAKMNGISAREQMNLFVHERCTSLLHANGVLPFYRLGFAVAVNSRPTYNGAEWDDELIYEMNMQNDQDDEPESSLVGEIRDITE